MTIPKINSAHGSDTRNIINRAIDLINVQGKSIQDLVAEGQLTPSQYAQLIKNVNGLIAKGDIQINDLSEDLFNALKESDPTFNLLAVPRDKSVTPGKTTFMETGKNLFNINDVKSGYSLNSYGDEVVSASNVISDYIPCLMGDVISASHDPSGTRITLNGFRIVVYDSEFNKLEVLSSFSSGDSINVSGARYFRVNLSKDIAENKLQIEKGSVSSYEEYTVKFNEKVTFPESVKAGLVKDSDLRDLKLTPNQTTFLKSGKNKFNPNTVKMGYNFTRDGEETVFNDYLLTDYIEVSDGTTIRFSYNYSNEFNPRLVVYNDAQEKIKVYPNFESGTAVNHPDAMFFRIAVTKSVADNKMQIEFGELTPYEPYKVSLDNSIKVQSENVEGAVTKRLTGETVVFFGDSITQDSRERSHYPIYFEELTGARSINQGYGGTTMAKHSMDDFRPFSMTYLLQAKLTNDYTAQEAVITQWQSGTAEEQLRATNYILQLDKFKAIDFNDVYAITMLYGANDHGGYIGTIEENDPEGATFIGAYNHVIKTLQENYPHLGIVLITPIIREFSDPSIENRTELFVQAVKDVAELNNLPCYDAYQNLGFNKYNWKTYYSDDGLHPIIEKGQPRMGERISSWLNSMI